MRKEILREAKESFEKQKRRDELKRARGEDTWILPAVKKRLGLKGQTKDPATEKKKRKKKKEKKHKKQKATKDEKEQCESDDSVSEGEEMWVEKEETSASLSATFQSSK